MSRVPLPHQPEINIGTLGHVDNGKSTLVLALSDIWTAKHSEEMKRGITIRVGYADTAFYKCTKCDIYGTADICINCGSPAEFLRAVSFVDCPGHHSLMVTMLAGAALMDGALLIISASERCPQPQDREHLVAAQITGLKNIKDERTAGPLVQALQDDSKEVRQCVGLALKEITGYSYGEDYAKWQRWWEDNKDKYTQ